MNGHTMSESDWFDLKAAPSGSGCLNCSAEDPPGWWFHLRRCTYCGHVGCCDSSPQQHASEHYRQTGHPIMQSFEPGEEWFYDHRTNVFVTGRLLRHRGRIRSTSRSRGPGVECQSTGRNVSIDLDLSSAPPPPARARAPEQPSTESWRLRERQCSIRDESAMGSPPPCCRSTKGRRETPGALLSVVWLVIQQGAARPLT
jgi:hypothetical protein